MEKETNYKAIEEAMKTMTTEKLQRLYDDLGAGKITINQVRAEYGLPPHLYKYWVILLGIIFSLYLFVNA